MGANLCGCSNSSVNISKIEINDNNTYVNHNNFNILKLE